jgi:hypothetical protein
MEQRRVVPRKVTSIDLKLGIMKTNYFGQRIKKAKEISTTATAMAINSLRRLRLIMFSNGPSAFGQRKNDPHQRLEELERWSARATLLIFLGIVVEIATTERIGSRKC